MTTSDLSAQAAGLPDPAAPIDPAVLAGLASAYFPEFSGAAPAFSPERCAGRIESALKGAPPVPDVRSVAAPSSIASVPDLLVQAGLEAVRDSDALYSSGTAPGSSGFGFLESSRPLFAFAGSAPAALPPLPGATSLGSAAPSLPAGTTRPVETGAAFGSASPSAYSQALSFAPVIVPAESEISSGAFDVEAIRKDFPILAEKVNGRDLVWLDNAATTQKPRSVIDRLSYFYEHENSNIHRAAHTLAARSTDAYEAARAKVARFLGAGSAEEIVFVRGATEAINLAAWAWARPILQKDDEIILTILEHHANIVPWQMVAAETGARIRVAPVDETGQIVLSEFERLFSPRTKVVSLTQVSNALGTVTPVAEMIAIAHRHGVPVLVDGAQAVSHMAVDVRALDADFYIFSGHKVFGPTGIGALYGKRELLEKLRPWQGGGNMIADVTFERTVYQGAPARFEAGTGNIADAVGLGAAIDYVTKVGMANIARWEHELLEYGTEALRPIPGLRLVGTAAAKASVLSFVLDGFKTEEVGSALSKEGIAVRSGHHCAQPILRRFGLEATVRPSLAFYNTKQEIDALVTAVWNLKAGRTPGLY